MVWVQVASLAPECPIINHGVEWGLSLTSSQEICFTVYTDATNFIRTQSTEVCPSDTWVCVAATYAPSSGTSTDLKTYINATECTGVDGDLGTFSGQVDGLTTTLIGTGGVRDVW